MINDDAYAPFPLTTPAGAVWKKWKPPVAEPGFDYYRLVRRGREDLTQLTRTIRAETPERESEIAKTTPPGIVLWEFG